ncbi:type II toxin-antitoxin system PemK/MazF family toxin [uncultured Methanobacterium sp.]|uniref:type II toxin-antitoxin system PemK/MazF family toxin n=1 Tax=uncultured Methanobacterium sp. TaxID=176306 RepID=UPI002AA8DEE6|nr:type II toxin-antitoxin system PemK/MazF family toxin [uncultured Methanobacterium sp.]
MKGKIVLLPFPFTDLTASKLRPALVIYEGERDIIVSFISSKIPQVPLETSVILEKTNPSFEVTGLKTDSIIKLDKIATILKELVIGELGELDEILTLKINEKLKNIFKI